MAIFLRVAMIRQFFNIMHHAVQLSLPMHSGFSRSVKRCKRLLPRKLPNTGSTVANRRVIISRPASESIKTLLIFDPIDFCIEAISVHVSIWGVCAFQTQQNFSNDFPISGHDCLSVNAKRQLGFLMSRCTCSNLECCRLDRELATASIADAKNSRSRAADRCLCLNKSTDADSGCHRS